MAERGVHETSPMGSGKRPLDHCRSKTTQARMCEAYVTLGRLSHVKMRHEEDAEKLRALLDERVGGAYESALAKVRRDYEALKDNLEKLYIKSIDDLEAHKLAVEAPTRARVELIEGQKTTAARVEEDLKALMANPDEDTVLRELPEATRNVGRVLKSSVKLVGLHFPEINALTAEDFPSGRLHNVVIAPKRSGDRRKQPSSAEPTAKPKVAGAAAATAAGESGGGQGCCRDGRRAPGWSERVPPTPTTPRSRPTGEREEEGRGGVEARPCATERAEACDRCACACQASDVWVAYRSLRKRYHALKDQADVEEVRVKVEDRRRELQAEFDTRRGEMEMELEQKRRELMEGGHRLARARAELEEKRKELLESSHGLSEAEVQSLRGIVQASMKECQAVQQESAELREKVLLGQQCLERALQETLAGREEIARRKHHGQVLLARIRYLKGMTSACVDNNIAAGKLDGGGSGGADHGGGLSSGGGGSGDSRDGGDGEGEATTNSFSSSSSTFESGDDDDDCGGNDGNDNNNVSGENNNASDSDVGRTAGDSSTSDDDSDMKTSARPPLPPAYDEVSAFFDDSEADDDDDATISVRVRRGWTEASKFDKASRGAEGTTDGKPKSRFLEKERENLTREINRLSAELAAAGVSGFDNTRFSNPDETRSNDVSPIQPKPKPTPPPPLARSSQHSKKGPGGVGVPAPRRHAHTPVVDNNNQDGNSINNNNHSNINNNSSSNNNNNNHSNNHNNNNSSSSNNNNHSKNHSNSHSNMNNDSNNGVGVGGGSGGGYGAYGGYGMKQPFPEGRRRRRSDHRSGGEPAQARAAGGGFERTKSGRAPPPHPPPHLRPQQQPRSQSWSSSSFAAYPAHPAYRVSGFPREDDDDGVVTGSDMSLSPRSSRKGSSRGSSRGVRCR